MPLMHPPLDPSVSSTAKRPNWFLSWNGINMTVRAGPRPRLQPRIRKQHRRRRAAPAVLFSDGVTARVTARAVTRGAMLLFGSAVSIYKLGTTVTKPPLLSTFWQDLY